MRVTLRKRFVFVIAGAVSLWGESPARASDDWMGGIEAGADYALRSKGAGYYGAFRLFYPVKPTLLVGGQVRAGIGQTGDLGAEFAARATPSRCAASIAPYLGLGLGAYYLWVSNDVGLAARFGFVPNAELGLRVFVVDFTFRVDVPTFVVDPTLGYSPMFGFGSAYWF